MLIEKFEVFLKRAAFLRAEANRLERHAEILGSVKDETIN